MAKLKPESISETMAGTNMLKKFLSCFIVVSIFIVDADGHGRLIDPPSRSSLWRFADNPLIAPHADEIQENLNDDNLDCGGVERLIANGGRCGPCGDPVDGERENEAGGKYALGIISKHYRANDLITASVHMTIGHTGFFEFRLCPWNDPETPVTQECLDGNLLQQENGDVQWELPSTAGGIYNINLQLPEDVTCTQCVLQWKHTTRDFDPESGRQEREYYGCSDIAIEDVETSTTTEAVTTESTRTEKPTTTETSTSAATETLSTTTTTTEAPPPPTTTTITTTATRTTTPRISSIESSTTSTSGPTTNRPVCTMRDLQPKCLSCSRSFICVIRNFPIIFRCGGGLTCDSESGFCSSRNVPGC